MCFDQSNKEAVALEKTVEMVLNPFYERGILVGAEGSGRPSVSGEALPSHDKPMLSVNLSAMVRPMVSEHKPKSYGKVR